MRCVGPRVLLQQGRLPLRHCLAQHHSFLSQPPQCSTVHPSPLEAPSSSTAQCKMAAVLPPAMCALLAVFWQRHPTRPRRQPTTAAQLLPGQLLCCQEARVQRLTALQLCLQRPVPLSSCPLLPCSTARHPSPAARPPRRKAQVSRQWQAVTTLRCQPHPSVHSIGMARASMAALPGVTQPPTLPRTQQQTVRLQLGPPAPGRALEARLFRPFRLHLRRPQAMQRISCLPQELHQRSRQLKRLPSSSLKSCPSHVKQQLHLPLLLTPSRRLMGQAAPAAATCPSCSALAGAPRLLRIPPV